LRDEERQHARPDAAPTQFRSERDGRDALVDPGVDTEHAQNPEQRSISATQGSPEDPGTPAIDHTLSKPRDPYVTDVPQRRLTLSVVPRRLVVGTPSWKHAGRTVSRLLPADDAALYREWIANRRALEQVLDEMRDLSHQAAEQILASRGRPLHGPDRPRRRAA
jgi:hypothetical protein